MPQACTLHSPRRQQARLGVLAIPSLLGQNHQGIIHYSGNFTRQSITHQNAGYLNHLTQLDIHVSQGFQPITAEPLSSVGDITYTSHYRLDIRYGPGNLWASLGSYLQGSEKRLRPLVVTFLPFLDVGEILCLAGRKESKIRRKEGRGFLPQFA